MQLEDIVELGIELNSDGRYTYNGKQVPRATEVISKMIHEDAIVQWANSLGFRHQKYLQVLNAAAVYGTKVHHGIECIMKNIPLPEDTPENPINGFKLWWDTISKYNTLTVLGEEEKLSCKYYGGTYDLLLKINNKVFLVDFKTSNHVTYKYWIQLSSYNKLLREEKGIMIDGAIILQLSKNKPAYTEYVLDFSNIGQKNYFDICERTFLSLLYSYYHIHYLEEEFNNVQSI